jgi:hypothetical protein
MFHDDIELVRTMVAKYGPLADGPIVECGGLLRPCVAKYEVTVAAMAKHAADGCFGLCDDIAALGGNKMECPGVRAAQMARYQNIERPLSFLGDYLLEDPGQGGVPIEGLAAKYGKAIGTAILLSVLEHVDRPWEVPDQLVRAMVPGGLIVVSVPWAFPWHGSPGDHFRYSPTGLGHLFRHDALRILETAWRLDVPASAGVLDIRTGLPQIIQSAYLVARVMK